MPVIKEKHDFFKNIFFPSTMSGINQIGPLKILKVLKMFKKALYRLVGDLLIPHSTIISYV